MKDKIVEYNPTPEDFLIWLFAKHKILYRILWNRCQSDFEKGKITINELTDKDEEYDLANMLIQKEKLEKDIEKKSKKLKEKK